MEKGQKPERQILENRSEDQKSQRHDADSHEYDGVAGVNQTAGYIASPLRTAGDPVQPPLNALYSPGG